MEKYKKEIEAMTKEIAKLFERRNAEKDGAKKEALTKEIKVQEKKLEELEKSLEGKESGRLKITAKSTTGRETYRRAGIRFTGKFQDYEVSEEDLEILKEDPFITIGTSK